MAASTYNNSKQKVRFLTLEKVH